MTHVVDLTIAGNENFLEKVKKGILDTLTISKVEKGKFRFTGWNIERYEDHMKFFNKRLCKQFERDNRDKERRYK